MRPSTETTPECSFAPPAAAVLSTGAPPARILIVEDEAIAALALSRCLTAAGYDVVGPAADAETALEVALADRPDLVLMDIGISGDVDGIATAERLRQFADFPIIFVTGNSDDATVRRAQATHPFNYVVKPVREQELRISIHAALHHHRLATELRASRNQLESRVQERTAELERTNGQLQSKISEQLQLERELRLSQAETEAASRSKSRFFRNVSHEIRTPMNGIVGMLDILAETAALDGEQRGCLDVAHQCAAALIATVDELIEFSELEAGQTKLQRGPVVLRDLFPAVLRSIDSATPGSAVEITCDIAPEVPIVVYSDADRLSQVLRHLLGFCLRQARPTDVEVVCDCLDESDDRAHLHISIRDSSAGFAPELQKRLQRVFTQPDFSRLELDGLGLGIAIPAMLVRRMGGILWLETIAGIGNTVHCALWLPTEPEAGAAPGA